jgi:hypothetical protein
MSSIRWNLAGGCNACSLAVLCLCVALASSATADTTFLHHFDVGSPINNGAGTADYAKGNPAQLVNPPSGPGGQVIAGGKFGNALDHTTGGRIQYSTADNFNPNKGTMEMWIKGTGITGGTFQSLWGTDTTSGNTDIRFYIYNDQANDNLRSLGGYQQNGGGSFWEIERAIPADKLDSTNWHHVVWQYDSTPGAESTALWWDGILLGNTPDDGFAVNPRTDFSNTRMHIGESQGGSAPFFGHIDEFRISDSLIYDINGNFTPPTSPFQAPSTGIAGDYNDDKKVDAADYTIWRDKLGSAITLPNDSTPGQVTIEDYNVWKGNFGMTSGSGALATAMVPEPAGVVSAMFAIIGFALSNLGRRVRCGGLRTGT